MHQFVKVTNVCLKMSIKLFFQSGVFRHQFLVVCLKLSVVRVGFVFLSIGGWNSEGVAGFLSRRWSRNTGM